MYCVHLIACGYSQVPVINDVTFCILLLMMLHFGYSAEKVTVEKPSYMGTLKKKFIWSAPKVHLRRKRTIYHFKQLHLQPCSAACYYYKKAVEILKSSSFFGGSIDPSLYFKKSAKDIVYVALYVDDNLIIGDIATIDDDIEASKRKGLLLNIGEWLQD